MFFLFSDKISVPNSMACRRPQQPAPYKENRDKVRERLKRDAAGSQCLQFGMVGQRIKFSCCALSRSRETATNVGTRRLKSKQVENI